MADETITAATKEESVSEIYPSLLTTTRSHQTQEKLISACCMCCEQCNGSKSSMSSTTINYKTIQLFKQKLSDQHQQLRETLQIYLIRTQVEEAMMDDKQAALMQHLSSISNAFEAAIQYMQSLQVSYLAAKRVLDMSQVLLAHHPLTNCTDENFTSYHRQVEIEKEKKMSNLQELMECCSKNVVFSKDTRALLDDHRNRRKDFFLASANFKSLLETSRLSVSQLEKLQRQHDTILKDFQQSRRLVDAELPRIIKLRLEAFQQIFHKIAELYGDVDYDIYAANLFELIAGNMCRVAPNLGKKFLYVSTKKRSLIKKYRVYVQNIHETEIKRRGVNG